MPHQPATNRGLAEYNGRMSEEIVHFNKKRNYQRISKDKVVQLKYLLCDRDSEETLAYRDDMIYLHGGYGSAFPKVEAALEGLEVDMKADVDLDPDEGYGEIDASLIMQIPSDSIPSEAHKIGVQLEGQTEDGSTRPFTVTEVGKEELTVNGNHPLAGRKLSFSFEVLEIRDARPAEIEAGFGFSETPKDNA